MIEHTNTPELRFSEFKEEWISKYVGEYFFFKNGLNKGKEFFGSGSPIVNFTDVFNNRGLYSKTINGKVSVTEKEINQFNVAKGDVFFTRTSEVIEEIGMPSVLLDHISDCVFSGFVLRAREFNPGIFAESFKKYMFTTYNFRKEMIKKSSMTTRALTSGTAISNMVFIFPENINEQRKIGDFFSKLDQQIELEEKKLELLEQQKRGYMQKIFSQQLRFKDEKGNDYPKWIFKKFEEIFKVVPSKKYQIKSSEIEDNASIPVIDQGQNLILGFSNNKEKVFNDFKNVIIYGDHTTVIKRSDKPFIIGGDGVKLLTSKVDSDISYLYNALQYFNVKSEGYKRHFSILKNKDFYISTSIEEQKKIANIFNKLDKYIEKQFAKVELLKQRKQGLLQKMFV